MTTAPISTQVINLLADNYGVAHEELELMSDLTEDIDLKSDLEALARFVQAANLTFEIDLTIQEISRGIDEESVVVIQDIVNLVEDAMLE